MLAPRTNSQGVQAVARTRFGFLGDTWLSALGTLSEYGEQAAAKTPLCVRSHLS